MEVSRFLALTLMTVVLGTPELRAQTPSDSAVEPAALEALNRMGSFLRTLKSFQVTAEVTDEEVLADGLKLQNSSVTNIVARMPDRLFGTVLGDRMDRLFFYNGKTFTLYARRAGYYATIDAPPEIGKLATLLADKYGLEIPLEDLFFWGTSRTDTSVIKAAIDAGPGVVGGVTCGHYAFRQPGLDWQIWIQKGDSPLPRKLVITTLTDDARPQHTSVLTWNLAPSFDEDAFTFNPPDNAHKIVFADPASAGK